MPFTHSSWENVRSVKQAVKEWESKRVEQTCVQNALRGSCAGMEGREARGDALPQEQARMTWIISAV